MPLTVFSNPTYRYPMKLTIMPPEEMIEANISLPPSKSIAARALIMNALTEGNPPVGNLPSCDDTTALTAALTQSSGEVNVGLAGTAMRFLTSYYAVTPGSDVVLDGSDRMRQRPIGALVEALRSLGADIEYIGTEGYPPLHIRGKRLAGGSLTVEADISSQFVSSLIMAAPAMEQGLHITLDGPIVSRPYISLTLHMMRRRGIDCYINGDEITVNPGSYVATETTVEGDWSAASFWYEIAAISAGMITLGNLEADSAQPDRRAAEIFGMFGVDTTTGENGGTELMPSPELSPRLCIDFSDTPDLAQPVAVTAAMLGIPFRFTGLETLHHKECDRVEALIEELLKTGTVLESTAPGNLEWDGMRRPIDTLPEFNAHGDHRMAMALAPVSIFIPGITIDGAETVAKSYPSFWEDLRHAGFEITETE